MALFSSGELSDFLQYQVSEDAAALAERVAWGWLKPALGYTERPEEVPEEVFSWAIELGAIAHENPAGLASQTRGDETNQWSRDRRDQILAAAADGSADLPSRDRPRGSFPKAQPWPDPAQPYAAGRCRW